MHSLARLAALLALPLLSLAAPAPQTSEAPVPAETACASVSAQPSQTVGKPVSAQPSQTVREPVSQPSELATIRKYYLKTTNASNKPDHFNNLFLTALHVGAGLNDAVLSTGSKGTPAFLNSTLEAKDAYQGFSYQQFDIGYYQYGLTFNGNNYAGWASVEINAGAPGIAGFSLNETGLVWNNGAFGGWMACDWWHGGPQLFVKHPGNQYAMPDSCAVIQLVPEYI